MLVNSFVIVGVLEKIETLEQQYIGKKVYLCSNILVNTASNNGKPLQVKLRVYDWRLKEIINNLNFYQNNLIIYKGVLNHNEEFGLYATVNEIKIVNENITEEDKQASKEAVFNGKVFREYGRNRTDKTLQITKI